MPANYVLLEKITVGAAGASSVTFNSIPQTGYTDLVLAVSARSAATGNPWDDVRLEFNGSGGTAYSTRMLYGDGTSPASASTSGNATMSWSYFSNSSATANTFGSIQMYIPNYTSANYKSISSDSSAENNATQNLMALTAGLWSNTAAVTSIKLTNASATNFVQYSTFYLYGVAKLGTTPAIVPYATGGDTIMTDGTYWYHAFVSSGTFTPTKGITASICSIGGGGGGGLNMAGGGGGGELDLYTTQSLTTTGYTVTVGAGGAKSASYSTTGSQGGTSSFSSLVTSLGGGGGGSANSANGGTGGSGGGGGYNSGTGGTTSGSNTFAGGTGGNNGSNFWAGGGGGATAVGSNGSNTVGGNGGAGYTLTSIDSNFTSTFLPSVFNGMTVIGSGGGGGVFVSSGGYTRGTGGTGAGSGAVNVGATSTASSASTSYGSGGGGGGRDDYSNQNGTNGYQGLVIVRYPV